MASARYCDPRDVRDYALPSGALANPGRLVEEADLAASALVVDDHGLESGDRVQLRADAGGVLPAPLLPSVSYYVLRVDDATIQLAETLGGAPVTLTSAGDRFVLILPSPVEAAIAWASVMLEQHLPAHVLPLDPQAVPPVVRITAAELAGWRLQSRAGGGGSGVTLTEIFDQAQKRLARWVSGVPIRGEASPPRAGRSASAVAAPLDARGWRQFGGR